MSAYAVIGKFIPKKIRHNVGQMLSYAGFDVKPERFLGFAVFFGLALGFILATVLNYYKLVVFWKAFIMASISVEVCIYAWLTLSADSKAKFIEEVLPDALQLMASNIRGGLTTDKALISAARPEFGPLSEEIKRIGREAMAGRNITDSLEKTKKRVNSQNFERSIDLIIHSLKSGGKLGDLLDQTAEDLRDQQIMQKEISAGVLIYVIFVFIAIGLGAPILFAMSSFLVKLLTKNMQMISAEMPKNLGAASGASMPISITSIQIDPTFISTYSLLSLAASSILGSMVMGLIMKGEEKEGFKYVPILLLLSIGLFLLGGYVLDRVLGGMMEI